MISITQIPEGWESWFNEFVQLDAACRVLKGDTPAIRHAREGLKATVLASLNTGLATGLPTDLAGRIFFHLAPDVVEEALIGPSASPYARLAERGAQLIPRFKVLPPHVAFLSEAALASYIEHGLRYHRLAKDRAHEFSLTRSKAYGLDIWRADYPRKNPALGYWESKSVKLPDAKLSPEGTELIIEQIKACAKNMPASIEKKVDADRRCDWRILLAIQLSAPASTGVIFHRYWPRSFGKELAEALLKVFEPKSDHDRLLAYRYLQDAPSLLELLDRPACRPAHLSQIFTPMRQAS